MEEWEKSLVKKVSLNKDAANNDIISTGTKSLIFALIGIFSIGIIFGPMAIVYGVKNTDPTEKTNATAGIVLGIIAIIVFIFAVIGFIALIMWLKMWMCVWGGRC